MTGRLGEPDRLGLILGRLGESAELGEAHDQPEAVVDRGWSATSKVLVDPIGGQRREVVGGKLDHPFVLAAEVLHLLEIRRGEDAKLQVPQLPCDRQRAGPRRARLVQLAQQRVDVRRERVDAPQPALVVQALGEGLGLAQAFQLLPDFTELVQHRPELEADLERLLQRGQALRHRPEDPQRLLEPGPGIPERRACALSPACRR